MAPKTRKTRKAPKAPAEGSENTSTGHSVKLANTIRKLEFLDRLIRKSISAFGGAPGADTIHSALNEARTKVESAIADARNLPVGFRFGTGGASGITIGAVVSLKEKAASKYGGTLSGDLKVREIGNGMILVETPDEKMAWVPKGHLARVETEVVA